jgi:hypothetical protein
MTIPPDLEAQILRYYHVEKWPLARSRASCMYTMAPWRGSWARLACPGSGRRRAAPRSSPICRSSIRPCRVPDADRQPAVRDGTRTRLPWQRRSLPPPHLLYTGIIRGVELRK